MKRDEAISLNAKIRPIASSTIELSLAEGISQLVSSKEVSQQKILMNKNFLATWWKSSGLISEEHIFGLTNAVKLS